MFEQNSNQTSQPKAEDSPQIPVDSVNQPNQPTAVNVVGLPGLGALLKNTFHLIKSGFWKYVWINFLTTILIPLVILGIIYVVSFLIHPGMTFILIFSIISVAALVLFVVWKYPLMIHFTDALARGERKIPFKRSEGYILGLAIFGIIFGFVFEVGLLLLIIPGIIWFVRYFFTTYTYCL